MCLGCFLTVAVSDTLHFDTVVSDISIVSEVYGVRKYSVRNVCVAVSCSELQCVAVSCSVLSF